MSNDYQELDDVLDAESWEWLNDNYPALAIAVQQMVGKGKTPEAIKRRMVERLGAHRIALAQRCELASRYLGAK